jgi:hypothetical protein
MVREDITRKIAEDLDNIPRHAFAARRRNEPLALGHRRHRLGAAANRVDQCRARRAGRHHRRVDRRAHRHRSRHIAGDGETTATSPPKPRARRSPRPASADRHRPHRARHRDARPDLPGSATKVQTALGINDCIAFDVHAVCTGFLYALSVADNRC